MPRKRSRIKNPKAKRRPLPSFGEREFVCSVWKTMKEQEKKHPGLTMLYRRLEPEFEEITQLIHKFLASTAKTEEEVIHEILSYGEKAILPLVDILRHLKKGES